MSDTIDIRVPHWADEANMGFDAAWHRALNDYAAPFTRPRESVPFGAPASPAEDGKSFMYDAKHAAHEVPRLALLFAMERQGKLRRVHRQCSHDHRGTPVPDNHLTCCLGVACRACPHLAALDAVRTRQVIEGRTREDGTREIVRRDEPISDEQRDLLKAWTCVTHILGRGGDPANEGYVLTTDDRMYWDGVYSSLAGGDI